MYHSFDVDIAAKYGILEAILLNHINFWVQKNEANGEQFYNGRYWTYNTVKAYHELYPYATSGAIRRALNHLKDEGLIETGNFNKVAYDRTLWYTITENGKCICQKRQMDLSKSANGFVENSEPIPDIEPYIKPDIYNRVPDKKRGSKRLKPPTLEEVRAYCEERKNNVDPQRFIDYYQSQSWKKANGRPVTDWKACVRTWEQKDKKTKLEDRHDYDYDEIERKLFGDD